MWLIRQQLSQQKHMGLMSRGLAREDVEKVWQIDGSEAANGLYLLRDGRRVMEGAQPGR